MDQGCLEEECLHKPAPGADLDLVLVRLADAPGRIRAAVDGEAFVIPVDEEAGDAGEKLDNHLLRIVHHADFPVGQVLFGKSVGVRRHVLGLDGGECLQDPEYGVVLGKSIDKIQAAIPPAHVDYAVYDVTISNHIQLFVEVSDIVR